MKKILLISSITCTLLLANELISLKDVNVTAQKTKENVQEVPIAMSIFDDISLEDKKIENLVDISYFVPNFYLLSPGDWGVFSPSMRGVFSSPELLSSTVGLYIDGIPITNTVGFDAILDDSLRVEVLRGPQSTLYGKNAEAGVINIITKKPDNKIAGKVGLELGEDNKQKLNLSLRSPIIQDRLYIGLSGRYYSKDGNAKNVFLNKNLNDRKNYYGKIYLRATPNDSLELALIASKYKTDDGKMSALPENKKNHRQTMSNLDEFIKNSTDNYAFKLNYDFENFNLETTTSYTKNIQDTLDDMDSSPLDILSVKTDITHKTLSQEIKLDGRVDKLKWLIGVFGSKFEKTGGFLMSSPNPQYNAKMYSNLKQTSLGVFTHLNYAFNDKFNLLGGIRYDRDKSKMDDFLTQYKANFKTENISPKIAFEYKLSPEIMTYVSIAKGYKAGGFHTLGGVQYPKKYKSESLINYELGTKTSLFDNSVLLNANIYYMDLNDMQVITYYGASTSTSYVSNAAKAKSYGFELDGNFIVNNNLSLFGSFGLNNAKFDEFKDFKGDYSNNYTPYAPKYTYSLGATYRGFGGVYASANVKGYGKMYLDNANTKEHKAYALVDAKIGYEWDDFDIYLYANNLFDKNHDLIGDYVYINPDREIGIKFNYRF